LFSISDINSAAADDFLHEDDMVGEEGEEDAASFPVRASVTIEKVILFFRNWKTRKLKRKRLI
jgi:hypothetical protein